jgi:hypothetical protein
MYVLTVCSVNVTNRVDPIEVFKLACTGRVISSAVPIYILYVSTNSDSDFQNFSSIDNQVAHYVSMLNICTCMCNLQWSKHALKNSTHTVSKNKNDVLPMQIILKVTVRVRRNI